MRALLVDALLIVRNTLNAPDQTDAALGDFAVTAAGASIGSLAAAVVAPRVVARLGPARWSAFTLFVALNLLQFGFTNFCPLALVLRKLGVRESGLACAR